MILLAVLMVVCLAVVALCVAVDDDDEGWTIVVGGAAGLGALMFGIGLLVLGLGRHYGRITCHNFAQQTGRETRFVVYNRFDTGDCLTRTSDGRWIPRNNLREFGDKR